MNSSEMNRKTHGGIPSAYFDTDNVYRNLDMFTCGGRNCYIIRCIGGDVLIDTGLPEYRGETEVWLMNYKVRLIVLTSGRNYCTGNAAYLSEKLGVPVAVSRYDVPLIEDNMCRRYYKTRSFSGPLYKSIEKNMTICTEFFRPDILLKAGDRLCDLGVDGVYMKSQVIGLDGHTRGTIGILDGKDLYCGDAAFNSGKKSCRPPVCESPKAAKKSIEKINGLAPARVLFSCGQPRADKNGVTDLVF